MDDLKIIEMYWSRDEQAIRATKAKYGRLLQSIAYNILFNREDGEECVSDTYGKAWYTIPPQKPGSLAAYLGRIVRNISINRWHSSRAKKRGSGADVLLSELADCVPSAETVESEIQTKQLAEAISSWLCGLSKDDRVLFLRRYWFGDALSTLAVKCGMTPGKMAGRMYRLRQSLKKALEREDIAL